MSAFHSPQTIMESARWSQRQLNGNDCLAQSTRVGEVAMIEIHSELRRIRQILARLSLVAGESSADLSARLAAAQSEVAACKQRLEAAFAESGRYWRGS